MRHEIRHSCRTDQRQNIGFADDAIKTLYRFWGSNGGGWTESNVTDSLRESEQRFDGGESRTNRRRLSGLADRVHPEDQVL